MQTIFLGKNLPSPTQQIEHWVMGNMEPRNHDHVNDETFIFINNLVAHIYSRLYKSIYL